MSRILAADPGAKETGLVMRSGDLLVGHLVVERKGEEMDLYVARVLEGLADLYALGAADILAVEGVNKPQSHIGGELRMIGLQPLIDLSIVTGAVLAWGLVWSLPVAVVVPDHNGRKTPLIGYPKSLVGPHTRKGTSDLLRHCRSAWDVSYAASRVLLARELAR